MSIAPISMPKTSGLKSNGTSTQSQRSSHRRRPMSRTAIQATESSPEIRRWPTRRSKVWTLQFLSEASDDENIIAVVAVGSAVRPAVPSVDLDLVVICGERAHLSVKPPLEIDLRTYRADQVQQEVARGNDLLGWAVKFG